MTRRTMAVMAFLVGLLFSAAASHAAAPLSERSEGNAAAPIVIEEYASLTCSHCADFFVKELPDLKERYVKTGKVRFVFHDFPLDGRALEASSLARCMPTEQYFPFVTILYKNLMTWAVAPNFETILVQYAKLGGLAEDKAKACLKDEATLDALVEARTAATDKYQIKATPTFVVNGGQHIVVGANLQELTETIEKLLKKK